MRLYAASERKGFTITALPPTLCQCSCVASVPVRETVVFVFTICRGQKDYHGYVFTHVSVSIHAQNNIHCVHKIN